MKSLKPERKLIFIHVVTGQIVHGIDRLDRTEPELKYIGKYVPVTITIKPDEKGWRVYKNGVLLTAILLSPKGLTARENFFVEAVKEKLLNNDKG